MTPKYVLSNCRKVINGDPNCGLRSSTYVSSVMTSIFDAKAGASSSGTVDHALSKRVGK